MPRIFIASCGSTCAPFRVNGTVIDFPQLGGQYIRFQSFVVSGNPRLLNLGPTITENCGSFSDQGLLTGVGTIRIRAYATVNGRTVYSNIITVPVNCPC